MLIPILDKDNLKLWSEFKLEWMQEIETKAKYSKVEDVAFSNITFDNAIIHIGDDNYNQFLINFKDEIIGAIECHGEVSYLDNSSVVSIDMIYIKEDYRNEWYDIKTIDEIKSMFGSSVEIISWYNSNEYKSFENMGMKKLYAKYRI